MVIKELSAKKYIPLLVFVSTLPSSVLAAEDRGEKNDAGKKVETSVSHRHVLPSRSHQRPKDARPVHATPPRPVLETISVLGRQEDPVLSPSTRRHSTVNVQVVSSEEIVRTGQSNAMAALEQLVPSVSSPSFSGVGSNRFIRTMQLRNLSADQTLILVNGKRRHLTSNFNANALSLIHISEPTRH